MRICSNCFFSTYAFGAPRPALICRHSTGRPSLWQLCKPLDTCHSFCPSTASKQNTRQIPLTRGKEVLIDAPDYLNLLADTWSLSTGHSTCYAARIHKGRMIYMHRYLLNAPDHLVVDHINHNGLDNRRSNLRLATPAQNSANRRPQTNRSSKYKGVRYFKRDKLYHAAIAQNKKRIHLGTFKNEIDAAIAYDAKARELHGEFAFLNFPKK